MTIFAKHTILAKIFRAPRTHGICRVYIYQKHRWFFVQNDPGTKVPGSEDHLIFVTSPVVKSY